MRKRLPCVAAVAIVAAALAAPQAAIAGGTTQKPSPAKIIWGT